MLEVFILHWNRPGECLATVASFADATIPLHITVIDNASEPGKRDLLKASLPQGVAFKQNLENRGWGGGLNPTLHEWLFSIESEFAVVAAHDALPQGACLNLLIKAMEGNDGLGMVSPEYGSYDIPVYSPWRGARLLPGNARPAGTVECVPFIHGTLMLFRKRCLQEIGVFDERFFCLRR